MVMMPMPEPPYGYTGNLSGGPLVGHFLGSLKYSTYAHNNERKSMIALTTPTDELAFNHAEDSSEIRVGRIPAGVSSNAYYFTTDASSYTNKVIYTSSGRGYASSTVAQFNGQFLDSSQVSNFGVSEVTPSTVILGNLLRVLAPEILGLAGALFFTVCLLVYALPNYGSASWSLGFTIAGNLLALVLVLFLGSKKVPSW